MGPIPNDYNKTNINIKINYLHFKKMDSIKNSLLEKSGMNFRQLIAQFIALGTVVSNALMLWKGLMIITNRENQFSLY